jgi:DeoR/GlpR family transcriptional regulator of sugar metabolism
MRVPQHIVDARRERLRGMVRQDGFLPLAEICRALDVSEATARRDLAAIEAEGHITRTYGGALADYNMSFASLGERAKRARSAKARIAQIAARQAPLQGIVYLDAGTTITAVARLIARRKHQKLTIVTNNLAIASILGGAPGVTLHLLGGIFLNRQATLFGDKAVEAVSDWKIDAAFLGAEAMNTDGIWNSHPEVVRLQRAVLRRCTTHFFCLDATKLSRNTPHLVSDWNGVDRLITDATFSDLQELQYPLKKGQLLSTS